MKPVRIQRKRTKGWKMPPNTVSVCRPHKWGNPFKIGQWLNGNQILTTEDCLEVYKNYLAMKIDRRELDLNELKGKNLACFCKLDQPCHADVLLTFLENI